MLKSVALFYIARPEQDWEIESKDFGFQDPQIHRSLDISLDGWKCCNIGRSTNWKQKGLFCHNLFYFSWGSWSLKMHQKKCERSDLSSSEHEKIVIFVLEIVFAFNLKPRNGKYGLHQCGRPLFLILNYFCYFFIPIAALSKIIPNVFFQTAAIILKRKKRN